MMEEFVTYSLPTVFDKSPTWIIPQQFKSKPGDMNMITGENDCTLEEELGENGKKDIFSSINQPSHDTAHDNESIIGMNDRYMDVCTMAHVYRGLIGLGAAPFFGGALYLATLIGWDIIEKIVNNEFRFKDAIFTPFFFAMPAFFAWLSWTFFVSLDWFSYRANPIRFDRARKMIHVWRSKRAGGCFSVPWDEDSLIPVRGHVENGPHSLNFLWIDPISRQIKRRISVGNQMPEKRITEFYEYVRRYMAEGVQSVPQPKYWVELKPSFLYSLNNYSGFRHIRDEWKAGTFHIASWWWVVPASPVLLAIALSHYIAMLTGRMPKWPEEMS